MKLLGILKEKFDKAETAEDKKKVLAEVGIELTDEELESVAGGEYSRGKIQDIDHASETSNLREKSL